MTNISGSFESVACSICGCSQHELFESGGIHLNLESPLQVVRCRDCRLLFMNPRPSLSARESLFKGIRPAGLELYGLNLASYGSVTRTRLPLFRERVKYIDEKYHIGHTCKLLDIGASSGELLMAATDYGWDAVGVEPSTEGVELGRTKGLQVVHSTAESLPFPDNSFDVVHSNHVFEHLANPQSAAKEAYRVLKPGGLIFIEVPNQFDNIQFFRDRLLGRIPVRDRSIRSIHHLYFFSRKSLRRLLLNARFEDVQILDRYGRSRDGISGGLSMLMRVIGKLYLGGPLIQGIARKKIE